MIVNLRGVTNGRVYFSVRRGTRILQLIKKAFLLAKV